MTTTDETETEAALPRRDQAAKCANPYCPARGTVTVRGEFCRTCRAAQEATRAALRSMRSGS